MTTSTDSPDLREAVARVVDPWAFKAKDVQQDAIGDVIRAGIERKRNAALTKADAILALVSDRIRELEERNEELSVAVRRATPAALKAAEAARDVAVQALGYAAQVLTMLIANAERGTGGHGKLLSLSTEEWRCVERAREKVAASVRTRLTKEMKSED